MHRILKQDEEYRSLELPLSPEQLQALERDVRSGRKLEPLMLWKGTIVSGYQQYDLCQKYHRTALAHEWYFPARDRVIAKICRQQLGREDLTVNAQAWLLSRLYGAEKEMDHRQKASEDFQLRMFSPGTPVPAERPVLVGRTSIISALAKEFHTSPGTLTRYFAFGRRLDKLEQMFPGVRIRILTGELEVYMKDLGKLMDLPRVILAMMIETPGARKLEPPSARSRKKKKTGSAPLPEKPKLNPEIKNMPVFDPDAELNGLTFTVGAWIRAVSRVSDKSDFALSSDGARRHLLEALETLSSETARLKLKLEVPRLE